IIELVARLKVRGVATMAGMAKDTVWKFVNGVSQPNYATRKRLGELFLDFFPGGVMSKPAEEGEKKWKLRPRLIELLPKGETNARAAVARLIQLARESPHHAPKHLDELHEWLDLQVRAEYWAERHYDEIARAANDVEPRVPKKRGPKPGSRRRKAVAAAAAADGFAAEDG
ncbi:MAG TPA: hypothetical protein VF771_03205, partial [Longimicrobiaceae bacterium]